MLLLLVQGPRLESHCSRAAMTTMLGSVESDCGESMRIEALSREPTQVTQMAVWLGGSIGVLQP